MDAELEALIKKLKDESTEEGKADALLEALRKLRDNLERIEQRMIRFGERK